jgi:uncharacterized membrane protein
MKNESFKSDFSGKDFPVDQKVRANEIRLSLYEFIKQDFPSLNEKMNFANSELDLFRQEYISKMLSKELSQLSDLEKKVLSSINEQTTISDKVDEENVKNLTRGQKIADKVASFGGSWTFIISFGIFIFIWINLNVYWFFNYAYDPYPFILLNLILSCIAALQAPVIMMSQNRQEEKDRERAKKDYMINLKSELEIRILHEKLDHLMIHQQQELMEIQAIQIDMMKEILKIMKP